MKKLLIISAATLLVLAAVAAGVGYSVFLKPNVNADSQVYHYLYVRPGTTWNDIQDTLTEQGWVHSAKTLSWAMKALCKDKTPQCGKYDLEIGIPNRLFVNRLAYGLTNKSKIEVRMTRYPEWVARNLAPQVLIDSAAIADVLLSDQYLQQRGFTRTNALAMFVRGDMQVQWCLSAEELGQVLADEYDRFWTPERRALAAEMNLTLAEVHTLASIVEEETNDYEDRRNVAGVYVNRLHKQMPLQACPTARYASGDFTLNRILKKHTQIDSPYNTYRYAGLPPGPIRIPSRESIDAVLHYAHHKYLYMCAKSDFSGTHNFSATLAQHNVYAREYQRELNKRRIGFK
ncbi:MAG: endolytic transglycosylase MltG [Paludibacteraceae bacterium]|nr:endolytic transglycosylase MltG [Paludibacteraceae bacterium]